ncbi:MAG: phosphoribosyltransferase family protein [Patescibacteria group bacterium]
MDEKRATELLTRAGAFLEGHFVFTSKVHCATYFNKDAVFAHPRITDELAQALALAFDKDRVEVVVAPEKGAIVLGHSVAGWLDKFRTTNDHPPVLSAYAEKSDNGFVIKRGYSKLILGKRVLVVEDQLTTGGSAGKVVTTVERLGGIAVGVAALNNGGTTAEKLGVPKLVTLLQKVQQTYPEHECPMCFSGITVNTEVGHGKEFVASTAPV